MRSFKDAGLPKGGVFGYDVLQGKKRAMILKYAYVFGLIMAATAFIPFGNDSCAQTTGGSSIAPQTCDTQVWQTMEMRAKMETEREIMQNQNLIFKPDSILAYTCFDKFAAHASLYGGSLFTHTKYWDGKEIILWGDQGNYVGMDKAMENVVTKSMETYMTSNYDHSMLGGRGELMGAAGLDKYSTTQVPSKGGEYACERMSRVWKAAKCMNFIHNGNFAEDGYHPYIDLKGHNGGQDVAGYQTYGDVRNFPANMKCDSSVQVDGNPWDQAWLKSRNEDSFGSMNKFYKYSEPLDKAYTDVRKKVDPEECSDPILTGVTVIESLGSGGSDYADGVCTNPGCVFKKGGDSGYCVKAGAAPNRQR